MRFPLMKTIMAHMGMSGIACVQHRYFDFTDISEISVNVSGYFDKNIGKTKINKYILKFMKILC